MSHTLEEITNKYIGVVGTANRERFDYELRTDVIGEIIKQARLEQKMTQEELANLIGVKKSQISKLENNTKDVRFSTILRVFDALKAQVSISVDLPSRQHIKIA